MNMTPTQRRTPIADFLADLLDFMQEKIDEAIADPTSQLAAIEEAACSVPVMHDRLGEDDVIWTNFVFVSASGSSARTGATGGPLFRRWSATNSGASPTISVGPNGRLGVLKSILKW